MLGGEADVVFDEQGSAVEAGAAGELGVLPASGLVGWPDGAQGELLYLVGIGVYGFCCAFAMAGDVSGGVVVLHGVADLVGVVELGDAV